MTIITATQSHIREILRLYEVTDFSIHDLALVDSPSFHISLDTCENGEVYNVIIRGGDSGGLDVLMFGRRISGFMMWVLAVSGVEVMSVC